MKDGKFVVLCVDDDPDILESLTTVLEANDYVVKTAATAEEGLTVYKEVKPDLLIVDLMMEEIDAGANFVGELKALNNKSPVYLLSSVGADLSRTYDTSQLGLAGVFQKPIDHKVLLGILKTKLKRV